MQQSQNFTPKSYLMVNTIVYAALIMGVVMITLVFGMITQNQHVSTDFEANIFMMIVPSVTLAGLAISRLLFNKFVQQAKQQIGLKQKLNIYRTAFIIAMALCEAPAIIADVAFMQEGNQFFLFFTITALVVMLTYFPTEQRTIKDLELRGDDLEKFNNKEQLITNES